MGAGAVAFRGESLSEDETSCILSLAQHSTHPCAVRIAEFIGAVQGNSGFPGELPLHPLSRFVPLLFHAGQFLLPFLECGT